jgi:hemerythrin-like metal-binding protein
MDVVTWTPALQIGHELIDEEHQRLFGFVKRLVASMEDDRASTEAKAIAAELVVYAKVQFAEEEALMRAAEFPGLEAHLRLHHEMAQRAAELEAGAGQVGDLLGFLSYWLREHVVREDAEIARYVQRR